MEKEVRPFALEERSGILAANLRLDAEPHVSHLLQVLRVFRDRLPVGVLHAHVTGIRRVEAVSVVHLPQDFEHVSVVMTGSLPSSASGASWSSWSAWSAGRSRMPRTRSCSGWWSRFPPTTASLATRACPGCLPSGECTWSSPHLWTPVRSTADSRPPPSQSPDGRHSCCRTIRSSRRRTPYSRSAQACRSRRGRCGSSLSSGFSPSSGPVGSDTWKAPPDFRDTTAFSRDGVVIVALTSGFLISVQSWLASLSSRALASTLASNVAFMLTVVP